MKGIDVSKGYGIGKVLIVDKTFEVPQEKIEDKALEIKKFNDAINSVDEDLKMIQENKKDNEEIVSIIEAHRMILKDPEIDIMVNGYINNDGYNAADATNRTANAFAEMLSMVDDAYIRERVADIKDVSNRIIRRLLGIAEVDISELKEPVVLIAYDLSPSDMAQVNAKMVKGIVTEIGGKTSHTAILANIMGIPAISGCTDVVKAVKTNDIVIVDGFTGEVIISPNEETINDYNEKQKVYLDNKEKLKKYIGKESVSKDGHHVELMANVGSPKDIEAVLENDAEGVGLFRSEFLFMDSATLPTEEEQYESYKKVVEAVDGKIVIIRTLDIGGDKNIPYLDFPDEENPFLGYRAMRYCLDHEDILIAQYKAILRAGSHGKAYIMLPMLTSIGEFEKARVVFEKAKSILREEGKAFDEDTPLGVMIETPSTAVMADVMGKYVDFFSIGTNDLTQYTLAADRMNPMVANIYSYFDPSVIRMIKMTIDGAKKNNIMVGMCGEAAGDPLLVPVLLGLGLEEFSMSPNKVLEVREQISRLSYIEMQEIAKNVVNLTTKEEVIEYIKNNVNI